MRQKKGLLRLGSQLGHILETARGSTTRVPLQEGFATAYGRGGVPAAFATNEPTRGEGRYEPLREGPAIPMSQQAGEGGQQEEKAKTRKQLNVSRGGEGDGRGVDTRRVRSGSAAPVKPYRRGSKRRAVEVAKSEGLRSVARRVLTAGMFAKSSRRTLLARRNTIREILGMRKVPPCIVEPDAIIDLAASLDAAGYRSAYAYLVELKLWAVEEGQAWTDKHQLLAKQAKRSLQRGLGPPRRAVVTKLDAFKNIAVVNGGPVEPLSACLIGALWLMRGSELRALLGDQVVVEQPPTFVTLYLAATKTDPSGTGAPRRLACTCDRCGGQASASNLASGSKRSLCPIKAVLAVCRARREIGLGSKDLFFTNHRGGVVTHEGLRVTLRRVLGNERASEHSLRRSGAQHYAQVGAPLREVQYLGRWGSNTILRYFEEAVFNVRLSGNALRSNGPWEEREVEVKGEEEPEVIVERGVKREVEEVNYARGGESGVRIRSSKRAVHAAAPGNPKTVCGWKFRRDGGWSSEADKEPITCGKCLRVLRQRESRIPGWGGGKGSWGVSVASCVE